MEFGDNRAFKTFHRAIIEALKNSEDKMATVASFQKLLAFEDAFLQFQLDFGIPYPDKTMTIVDEFFATVEIEKASSSKDVLDMLEESSASSEDDNDEEADDTTTKDAVPEVAPKSTPTVSSSSAKKGFFSF